MPLKIEETFQLRAPVERVWGYLTDPRQVVACLPGAELTAVQDESTFLGKVKVKVGPITAAYSGKVTITERDAAARVVRMVGEGRESGGAGSAKMTMTSTLAALPDGGTEVRVTADLDIVGRLAQFGRGMIESVNKQLFKQFTECVRATLEAPAAPELPATPPPPAATSATAALATAVAPVTSSLVVGGYAPPASAVAPTPAPLPSATAPLRLLPLVLRALWENLVRLQRSFWRLLLKVWRSGAGGIS